MLPKFKSIFFCILGLLYISYPVSAQTGTEEKLLIRGSNNYPPFEFVNEAGEPDGFNVDIIRALMQECGYKYDLKLGEWEQVIQDIENKKIDLVIGMIYSPQRAMNVRFTLPTCIVNRNFIMRDADNYQSFDELEGKELIVEKGGWFNRYLLANNFSGKIIESDDIYESLNLLVSGKHDAVLASDLVSLYAIKQLGMKGLKIKNMGIEPQNYSIAVNRDKNKLLDEINLGLQHLKLSGTYDQIYNKWFGIYESKIDNKTVFIALTIFFSIVFLLILFVWLLRKQVARATRMLNCSKQEVEIAIDAGKVSAWTYTIHNRIVSSLHGRSIGESGKSIDEIYETIHPEDVASLRHELESLSTGQKQRASLSFRIREHETEPYQYIETKMVRAEATRELPCRIVGTLKDMSDEILMQQKLEEYRMKSDFIIKTNDIILVQYDIANQLFSTVNDYDVQKQETYNLTQYLARVYPDDVMVASVFLENLNRAEDPKIETEFRVISKDGVYCWYSITAIAYTFDVNGKITSYMGLRRNNMKWKEINNDLILLREKAEASNRLKSAFLANMSHEIRTPLNAIVGFSDLIIETEDKEEREKFIDIVRTNNDLLLQLINDVLDLSKIESGHIDFCYSTFEFYSYFQELALSLKIRETKDVSLKYVNRYEDLSIYSDKNRISQVITNFVTNAFKFTAKGSITMDYLYENDGIRVSVRDTGIGIAQENQARVFERFEKINDFAQGTGLGLSICKVIVSTLQGKIGIESQIGVGSTFWFWIPCNIGMTESPMTTDSPETNISMVDTIYEINSSSVNHFLSNEKKTVLVAEDMDNNYLIINTIIKDIYNVIWAKDGLDAIEKAKQYNPDFILMDMKMPVMGGLDATREIRKFNLSVPIVALTAYVFDTNKQDAIRAGCNDFLTKPVNRSVLMEILDSFNKSL